MYQKKSEMSLMQISLDTKLMLWLNAIYERENIYNLLGDREYGGILFYQGKREAPYIQMTDFKDIYIRTNDKGLIKKLLAIEHNYHSENLWDSW